MKGETVTQEKLNESNKSKYASIVIFQLMDFRVPSNEDI